MKSKIEKFRDRALRHRCCVLICTALVGVVLTALVAGVVYYALGVPITEPGAFFASVYFLVLSLPALAVLRFFRTHDTRAQTLFVEAKQMLDGGARSKVAGLAVLMDLQQQGFNKSTINSITRHIDLSNTDLSSCSLHGMDFSNANLIDTNFSGADLRGADLSSAIVGNTNFKNAKLQGANFGNGESFSTFEVSFCGAEYDEITRSNLPRDINPEREGMVFKGAGKEKS